MARFQTYCRASIVTGTTEETMIDIDAPSGVTIKILKVAINGLGANANDTRTTIRLLRKSAIGTGSISGNIIKKNPLSPASVCTVTMNDNTNTYNIGTIVDVIDEGEMNGRAQWAWIATRLSNAIIIVDGGIFGVNVVHSGTAPTTYASIVWEE